MTRIYHRAFLVTEKGGVSALCFAIPRAINLKVASWTNRNDAVTCQKCLSIMRSAATQPQVMSPEEGKSDTLALRGRAANGGEKWVTVCPLCQGTDGGHYQGCPSFGTLCRSSEA